LEKSGTLLRSLSSDASFAVLDVRSQETIGLNQVVSYGVQVETVSYLMLMPRQSFFLRPGARLSALPLGATATFDVNFYNVFGQLFHVSNLKPNIVFSRLGLLSISWSTSPEGRHLLHLTGVREGITIIKVWVTSSKENEEIADYIAIRVGQVISPRISEITVGDIVCFSSPLTTPEGQPGSWSVEGESSLLEFVSSGNTGIAVGRKPGEIKVKHDISAFSTSLSSSIQVFPNSGVHLNTAHVPFLSTLPESEVTLPVVIPGRSSLSAGCTKDHLAALNSSLFDCFIHFTSISTDLKASDVFSCSVVFDTDKREHQAILKVKKDFSREQLETLSTLETNVHVSVQMIHAKVSSAPVILPLRPSYFVESKDIILTNHESHTHIVVIGVPSVLNDIQAEVTNDDTRKVLRVFPIEKIESGEKRLVSIRIPIALKDRIDSISQTTSNGIQVRVFSPILRQQEVVTVAIKWIFERTSQCIQVRRDPLYDVRSGWDITVDLLSAPFTFVIDNYQTITTLLLMVCLGIGSFLYFSRSRPQPLNSNFQGSNASFHAPSLPPTYGRKSPVESPITIRNGISSSTNFGTQRPLTVSSLGSTPSTNRRILSFDQSAASIDSTPDTLGIRSPSRPTSSPKGIVGRPLWSQQ